MNRSPFSERPDILTRSSPLWESFTVTTCGLSVGNGEKPTALSWTCSPRRSRLRRLLNTSVSPNPANVRAALFNIDLVRHILVVFANMSSGGPRQKIHSELALHSLVLEFLPEPL